jgi:hypothetical protein
MLELAAKPDQFNQRTVRLLQMYEQWQPKITVLQVVDRKGNRTCVLTDKDQIDAVLEKVSTELSCGDVRHVVRHLIEKGEIAVRTIGIKWPDSPQIDTGW